MTKFYYFLGHEEFQPEVLVQHAQLAEAAGFDGLLVSEHFMPWVDDAGAGGFAFSTLGAIAAVTKQVQLMTGVTAPLFRYHPGVVAQAAATIDRLSGGRFELGVGTGENLNEAPLGYTFPPYRERAARMHEALEIMRQLLDGKKLDYDGTYYSTKAAKLYSPPMGPVPILMAAGGPKSAAMAGQLAGGVITSVKDPAQAKTDILDVVRDNAPAGTTPTVVLTRWTVFAADNDEAWEALQPWRGLRAPNRLHAADPAELRQAADALPREEVLGKFPVVNSVEQIIDAYRPLVELGADIVGIQSTSTHQEQLIDMLGREVLPALREIK
jgi:coenzyme F420-dependent glucose-6-phosphate dehydrogenase